MVLCYKIILFHFLKHRLTSPTVVSTDDTDSGSELESVVHDMGLVASSGDEDDDGQ